MENEMNAPPPPINSVVSHDSMKSILKHLRSEHRFEISQRCPSIKATELSVPLHINTLHLKELELKVNQTNYSFEIDRVYNVDDHLYVRSGTLMYDVNKYGFKCTPRPSPATDSEYRIDTRGDWAKFKKEEEIRTHFHHFMYLEMKKLTLRELEKDKRPHIDEVEAELRRHNIRRNQLTPPFTHQLQLTVCNDDGVIQTEKVEYNQSIHDGMKYLIFKMFKGRDIIHVDTLTISPSGYQRYPIGMKLRVRNLVIEDGRAGQPDLFLGLIHPESLPLESIKPDGLPFNLPMYAHCKNLIIRYIPGDIWRVTARRVHFQQRAIPIDEISLLIDHWTEHGKELGTFYTFNCTGKEQIYQVFNHLRQVPGARFRKIGNKKRMQVQHQLLVPLSNTVEVKFFCKTGRKSRKVQTFNIKVQTRKDYF